MALKLPIPVFSGDVLRFRVNSVSVNTYVARVRLVNTQGKEAIRPLQVVTVNDRSTTTTDVNVVEEALLVSAAIREVSTTVQTHPGETYCRLHVLRNGNPVSQVIASYLWAAHTPSYPGKIQSNFEGAGRLRDTTTANPAAGSEVAAEPVETDSMWVLHSYQVQLAQGITQTPLPRLSFRDAGDRSVSLVPMGAALGASTTVDLTWGIGLTTTTGDNVNGGSMTAPLPNTTLDEGYDVVTNTRGIGAGSDYGTARILAREWLKVPD